MSPPSVTSITEHCVALGYAYPGCFSKMQLLLVLRGMSFHSAFSRPSQEWSGVDLHAKARGWLALLLLLHVVVHPLVHASPWLPTASGSPLLSAPVAAKHSQAHDCEICRTAKNLVPIVGFDAPRACLSSSTVVTHPIPDVFRVARFQLSSRAPPVS
jgi:hypothetical protein